MTRILTFAEMREALKNCQNSVLTSARDGMRVATTNVKAQAKRNCTPGKSPYDSMWFPTKEVKATRYGMPYTGAPYSYDQDKSRDPVHMRDAMYSRVLVQAKNVMGIVGNPKDYADDVHDGNHGMWPRPFIMDAIKEKETETRAILSDYIERGLLQACEGNLFPEIPSNLPTEMDTEDEE
jgi:hypothetical protein